MPAEDAGTVQVPRVCQPLLELLPRPYRATFFVPLKLDVKVITRFRTASVPDRLTLLATAFTVHWLLLRVPETPSSAGGSHPLPASLYRFSPLEARSQATRQELAVLPEPTDSHN